MKKLFKIPYTVFLHGSDLQLAEQNARKLKKFSRVCRDAKSVVVNSDFFKEHLLRALPGLQTVKVVYPCPNDIFFTGTVNQDELQTLRAQLGLNGKKVILTASRMVERKGYARVATLLPRLLKEIPNVVWIAIGDGPEKANVQRIIAEENVQGIVRMIPQLSQEQLFAFYHLADAFVLLTHKDVDGVEEAWGTVFIEAAACGLPVVAGASGGVGEAVENGVTGTVLDSGDEAAVVQSIVALLTHQDAAQQMGAKGKERAFAHFQWVMQIAKIFNP